MPETTPPTTTTSAPALVPEPVLEPAAAAPYAFPFDVPADLSTVADTDLRALHAQVREHAQGFIATTPAATSADAISALRACRNLAVTIANVLTDRVTMAGEITALSDDLDAPLPDPVDDTDDVLTPAEPEPTAPAEPAPTPTAVTAAAPPVRRQVPPVRDVARSSAPPQLPSNTRRGSMTASADVPGFSSGQVLTSFDEVSRAVAARIDQYPALTAAAGSRYDPNRRPVTVYDPDAPARQLVLEKYARHSVVQLRREFPDDLRVQDGATNGYAVAEHAASERRLPGGNLRASATMAVKAGRSLTAAAGWCAPSETIWDLLELESQDGLLDVPEMETTRGGWHIPINGGPDFSVIYGALGNAGNTHLTESQVIADVPKLSTEIPCPDFEEVRLGVDYYSLTGGLLQRRGYPEIVARFSRAAVVALAHKINQGYIAAIVAASGAANVIPSDPSGDDAASALLAAIELAVMDAKYRHRMVMGAGTMEVVLPWWVLQPIRAALSRRVDSGCEMLGVTDAQIMEWFTQRGAVPRLVYDWQDAFSGLAGGPGGVTPLTRLPATVQMLVYPAGTWVKAVQSVVALDTIYDSTLLSTNQYIAIFAEDGWAPLKMGPISRLYTVPVDPSGVVGCCVPVGS